MTTSSSGSSTTTLEMAEKDIKTMKLYTHIDRVFQEIKELGIKDSDSLDAEQLSSFDSLHYLGNQAITNAITATGITSSSTVLDIGSGLGGPARMLGHYLPGVTVDAYELQQDIHEAAATLTSRVCSSNPKVFENISHHHGNFLSCDSIPIDKYDAIVSWLVFLHIENRSSLFKKCESVLKPGSGRMYVEDFVIRGSDPNVMTTREKELLASEVYVQHSLPTTDVLRNELENCGFEILSMTDMTDRWTSYVVERTTAYRENFERHCSVHGTDGASGLLVFYEAMQELFTGGHLGGVAYCVQRRK